MGYEEILEYPAYKAKYPEASMADWMAYFKAETAKFVREELELNKDNLTKEEYQALLAEVEELTNEDKV